MAVHLAAMLAHGLSRATRGSQPPERVVTMIIVGTFATGQAKTDLVLLTSDPIGTFATTYPKTTS